MNFYSVPLSGSTTGGYWATNTFSISGGICYQIYLKFSSNDTTFNLKITDELGNEVFNTEDLELTATGVLNYFSRLPMKGIYTVTIYDASADESFKGILLVRT